MGNTASSDVPVVENEVTLRVDEPSHLFGVCQTLLQLNVDIVAVSPEGAPVAYIWARDPGAHLLETAAKNMILGEGVSVVPLVCKGSRMLRSEIPMTGIQARKWYARLRENGHEVIAVSPPNALGDKYAFVKK